MTTKTPKLEWHRIRVRLRPWLAEYTHHYSLSRGDTELARTVPFAAGNASTWRVCWLRDGKTDQTFDASDLAEAKRWAFEKAEGLEPPANWREYLAWKQARGEWF